MKKTGFIFGFVLCFYSLFLQSCNRSSPDFVEDDQIEFIDDSSSMHVTVLHCDTTAMYGKFGKADTLPFGSFAAYTDEISFDDYSHDDSRKLSFTELRCLAQDYQQLDFAPDADYYIGVAIETDSLEEEKDPNTDTYQKAEAWASERISISEGTELFVWQVQYQSQEGCGSMGGVLLFATIYCHGKIGGCTLISEASGSGESSYYTSTTTWCYLNENSFSVSQGIITTEEDEDGIEAVDTAYAEYGFQISDCKWEPAEWNYGGPYLGEGL